MVIKKIEAISEAELMKILGGNEDEWNCSAQDIMDCTSELASGGGTTDID